MSDSLHDFYTERAALAYAIEHAPDGAAFLPEYQIVDAHIRIHEQTFARAWTWPRAGNPRLPWCSLCGTRDFALAVGQPYCVSCAMLAVPGEVPAAWRPTPESPAVTAAVAAGQHVLRELALGDDGVHQGEGAS